MCVVPRVTGSDAMRRGGNIKLGRGARGGGGLVGGVCKWRHGAGRANCRSSQRGQIAYDHAFHV